MYLLKHWTNGIYILCTLHNTKIQVMQSFVLIWRKLEEAYKLEISSWIKERKIIIEVGISHWMNELSMSFNKKLCVYTLTHVRIGWGGNFCCGDELAFYKIIEHSNVCRQFGMNGMTLVTSSFIHFIVLFLS